MIYYFGSRFDAEHVDFISYITYSTIIHLDMRCRCRRYITMIVIVVLLLCSFISYRRYRSYVEHSRELFTVCIFQWMYIDRNISNDLINVRLFMTKIKSIGYSHRHSSIILENPI
jgi:hypothetical protein